MPGELTERWWRERRAADDDPPPVFENPRSFNAPRGPWSAREEADYVRWVFQQTGLSYDAADDEMRAVVLPV
jgi:hypothetical protein